MKRLLCDLAVLALLLSVAGQADADYVFTALDSINPLAQNTVGLGINNFGQIVGLNESTLRGFLLSGTTYTPVAPFGIISQARGINDSGTIVGEFLLPPFQTHGFLYSGGSYTQIDVPRPGVQTVANGINNSGEIVGSYLMGGPGLSTKGFLLSGGNYTTFSVPGSNLTEPLKINDSDQIVGIYYAEDLSSGGYHGFLLSGGSYSTLDVPGATETIVGGINNSGQIVGYYTAGGTQHGFLFSDGSYTTLDVPGSTATAIWAINDLGQIVGGYLDAASVPHGFLATPVPEPSTLLLLSLGGVAFIAIARYGNRRQESAGHDGVR